MDDSIDNDDILKCKVEENLTTWTQKLAEELGSLQDNTNSKYWKQLVSQMKQSLVNKYYRIF